MNEKNFGAQVEKLLNSLNKLFLKIRRVLTGKQENAAGEGQMNAQEDSSVKQAIQFQEGPYEAQLHRELDQKDAQMFVDSKYGRAAQSAQDDESYN